MSGTISFKYFPATTWRVPGYYNEFDASQANTSGVQQRALLIGQMLSSGTAVTGVAVLAESLAQVQTLCGIDSMVALMYAAYRAQDAFGECWILPILDNVGGAAATGTIAIAGSPTVTGVLSLYVGGILVPVGVTAGDTATVIGANIAAAINAAPGVPVTAAAAAGTVTLTAMHKGAAQNDVDLRLNYRANRDGEVTPAGITVTITSMSGGTLNPVLTTPLANLGNRTYDFIACPYTDSTSLAALATLLSDQSGRWSAIEGLYGHAFFAYRGTLSARATWGVTVNNQHFTVLGYYDSPSPAWLVCADFAGAHAVILKTNPAIGLVGQPLNMLAPPMASRDRPEDRNVMLYDGLATYAVDEAGQTRIDRSITTYRQDAVGQPDDSYLNTNLLFQAMYAARYIRTQVFSQFANKILVDDGASIGPGSPATTPSLIFQAVVGIYAYLASQFIVQDTETFSKNGYGQKGQKGQVLLYLPLDFSDQVIQVAALVQFQQTT